jgi:SpoVK/Ycf46/Vps4 family AAA+-type ATPase
MGNENSKKDKNIPSVYKGFNWDSKDKSSTGDKGEVGDKNVNINDYQNYYQGVNEPNQGSYGGGKQYNTTMVDNNINQSQMYNNTNNQGVPNTYNNQTYNQGSYQGQNMNNPNNQQNIGNQQNMGNQQNTSNVNQNSEQNHVLYFLSNAFNLFTEGNGLVKSFSFYEALFKYEEALKMVTNVYNKIEDEQVKAKTDHFLKQLQSQIDFTNYQIKHQYDYKKKAGFAAKDDYKPTDFTESIRKVQYDLVGPGETKVKPVKVDLPEVRRDTSDYSENRKDSSNKESDNKKESIVPNDLKNRILSEIVDNKPNIKFTDVIGLSSVKQILKEIIVLPNLRPDLFTGLRSPPRGLLLFGPPGVGKTMIAKAVATECNCTFFNISAASLTSKYLGESEKLVRSLFEIAYEKQPAVVFVDEIESILSKRTDNENDATKRLKTEFLVQFDGVGSNQEAKVLIIGATNRPHELDSAVLRRLPKRVYITPFNKEERTLFLKELMKKNENTITDDEYEQIANLTNNYSNSDLKELCREAVYEPIREISNFAELNEVKTLRPSTYSDFVKAVKKVRGTLNDEMLKELEVWNETNGAIS